MDSNQVQESATPYFAIGFGVLIFLTILLTVTLCWVAIIRARTRANNNQQQGGNQQGGGQNPPPVVNQQQQGGHTHHHTPAHVYKPFSGFSFNVGWIIQAVVIFLVYTLLPKFWDIWMYTWPYYAWFIMTNVLIFLAIIAISFDRWWGWAILFVMIFLIVINFFYQKESNPRNWGREALGFFEKPKEELVPITVPVYDTLAPVSLSMDFVPLIEIYGSKNSISSPPCGVYMLFPGIPQEIYYDGHGFDLSEYEDKTKDIRWKAGGLVRFRLADPTKVVYVVIKKVIGYEKKRV